MAAQAFSPQKCAAKSWICEGRQYDHALLDFRQILQNESDIDWLRKQISGLALHQLAPGMLLYRLPLFGLFMSQFSCNTSPSCIAIVRQVLILPPSQGRDTGLLHLSDTTFYWPHHVPAVFACPR